MEIYQDKDGSLAQKFDSWNLQHKIPKPATFVFAKGGTLSWSYYGKDKNDRPTIEKILESIPASRSKKP